MVEGRKQGSDRSNEIADAGSPQDSGPMFTRAAYEEPDKKIRARVGKPNEYKEVTLKQGDTIWDLVGEKYGVRGDKRMEAIRAVLDTNSMKAHEKTVNGRKQLIVQPYSAGDVLKLPPQKEIYTRAWRFYTQVEKPTAHHLPLRDGVAVHKNHQQKAEVEAKHKAEVETKHKAEVEAKHKAEVETKHKAEVEAKHKAEVEAKHKAEVETKHKAEVETKHKAEVEAKHKAEVETKHKAEVEAKHKAEVEAKHKAEVEAKHKAEVEAKHKAEVEAKHKAEVEAKHKAEVEAKHKAEVEAKHKAEVEAKHKAEVEAKHKAEVETKHKAEVEAKHKAEVETKHKAEVEAKHKAEVEAKRLREEAAAKRKAEEEANNQRKLGRQSIADDLAQKHQQLNEKFQGEKNSQGVITGLYDSGKNFFGVTSGSAAVEASLKKEEQNIKILQNTAQKSDKESDEAFKKAYLDLTGKELETDRKAGLSSAKDVNDYSKSQASGANVISDAIATTAAMSIVSRFRLGIFKTVLSNTILTGLAKPLAKQMTGYSEGLEDVKSGAEVGLTTSLLFAGGGKFSKYAVETNLGKKLGLELAGTDALSYRVATEGKGLALGTRFISSSLKYGAPNALFAAGASAIHHSDESVSQIVKNMTNDAFWAGTTGIATGAAFDGVSDAASSIKFRRKGSVASSETPEKSDVTEPAKTAEEDAFRRPSGEANADSKSGDSTASTETTGSKTSHDDTTHDADDHLKTEEMPFEGPKDPIQAAIENLKVEEAKRESLHKALSAVKELHEEIAGRPTSDKPHLSNAKLATSKDFENIREKLGDSFDKKLFGKDFFEMLRTSHSRPMLIERFERQIGQIDQNILLHQQNIEMLQTAPKSEGEQSNSEESSAETHDMPSDGERVAAEIPATPLQKAELQLQKHLDKQYSLQRAIKLIEDIPDTEAVVPSVSSHIAPHKVLSSEAAKAKHTELIKLVGESNLPKSAEEMIMRPYGRKEIAKQLREQLKEADQNVESQQKLVEELEASATPSDDKDAELRKFIDSLPEEEDVKTEELHSSKEDILERGLSLEQRGVEIKNLEIQQKENIKHTEILELIIHKVNGSDPTRVVSEGDLLEFKDALGPDKTERIVGKSIAELEETVKENKDSFFNLEKQLKDLKNDQVQAELKILDGVITSLHNDLKELEAELKNPETDPAWKAIIEENHRKCQIRLEENEQRQKELRSGTLSSDEVLMGWL